MSSLLAKPIAVSATALSLIASSSLLVPAAAVTPTPQEMRLEVRLSDRQVTLYRRGTAIKSYAIAIGQPGWETPTGSFYITQLVRNPTWRNPLIDEIAEYDDPDNPLGRYWIGFSTHGKMWYGFHGTNNPSSVGQAMTHGCLRMYNADIAELFPLLSIGTTVTISE